MSKYKVPTTKISCRVETDKLQKLLNDSGLSVSQLIDNLIDEKVSDNLRFDEEKEVDISFLRPVKEGKYNLISYKTDILKSCYGDLILICNMIRDYCNILSKKEESDDNSCMQRANIDYYIARFMKIYNKFADYLDYSWEDAIEKCERSFKKNRDNDINSDVGEDALVLAAKHKRKM